MRPSLQALTPEQKRAMLARMLAQPEAVGKPAFILQGLILDCMMNPAPIWNMRLTVRFFRKVDAELLRNRMQSVVERHPALRTTYALPPERELDYRAGMESIRRGELEPWQLNVEAQVEQRVHPAHTLELRVVDARLWSAAQLREQLQADAMEPYDVSRLPVCRWRFYQREHDNVMQLDIHHCAADLWSLELILAELEEPSQRPLPPSFTEFCNWQHAWFALPKARAMRKWWSEYLKGCPPLALAPTVGEDSADFVPFRVDADLLGRARRICRVHKITLFNLLLSVLQVTIGRSLELDDFAIGGTAANRPYQRFAETVGFFAQLVLYRRDLSEVSSWEELWAKNRGTIAEVLNHQCFPVTTTMPTPRTDVWISFQQYRQARWLEDEPPPGEPLGLRSNGIVSGPLGPREFLLVEPAYLSSPVVLEIVEQQHELQGAFRYRAPCFSRARAEFYVQDFQARLHAALAAPGASLDA